MLLNRSTTTWQNISNSLFVLGRFHYSCRSRSRWPHASFSPGRVSSCCCVAQRVAPVFPVKMKLVSLLIGELIWYMKVFSQAAWNVSCCQADKQTESILLITRNGIEFEICWITFPELPSSLYLSIYCRFIIYKLPRYKIGEIGSGVDYMYLDSSVGTWQLSKFMVNTSYGAVGNTLNLLYMGQAYKVRLCPCSSCGLDDWGHCDSCHIQQRLKCRVDAFVSSRELLLSLNLSYHSSPCYLLCRARCCTFFYGGPKTSWKVNFSSLHLYTKSIFLSPTARSTLSTMMDHRSWITCEDMDTLKVQ